MLSLLLSGCGPVQETTAQHSETASIAVQDTPSLTPLPIDTAGPTPTVTSLLISRCLEADSMQVSNTLSSGVVVFERGVNENGSFSTETFMFDMATNTITQITSQDENHTRHIVSPNSQLVAYISTDLNSKKSNLVISDSNGQRLVTIPREKEWVDMPAWLDNEHLLINISGLNQDENTSKKPATFLVLNPFSGERRILPSDFPGYIKTPSTIVPYWDGWSGVVYDQSLTRAIYPKFIGEGEGEFTYALWDMGKEQQVVSLESTFKALTAFNDIFPMPRWAPDGSQFVFRGLVDKPSSAEFNLFAVSRDGGINQLTNLPSEILIQDSNLSWSPNGRFIALFIDYLSDDQKEISVGLLDTEMLQLVDYCIPINSYSFLDPSPAVWAPDGKQFLVTDWSGEEHNNVILIDPNNNTATTITKDMVPVGWMLSP
jgi:Tol biopolymer transport system component